MTQPQLSVGWRAGARGQPMRQGGARMAWWPDNGVGVDARFLFDAHGAARWGWEEEGRDLPK
jgi:hypothetical protein